MKAMVLAMAASVGESAFAQWWHKAGEIIDIVIPIVLVTTIVAIAGGAIIFGIVQ